MKKTFLIYFIIAVFCVSILVIYYSHMSCKEEVHQRYTNLTKELHLKTETLINQKKEATLLLALSLAKDSNVKTALKTKDHSILFLKDITDTYTTYTTFKNVWIHLISADGISFLKSWTDRKGESILDIRSDIVSFLKAPKVTSVVSVGKYDMTIKAMVPIYDGNTFIGLFEVITKVDSIIKELSTEGSSPIVLVDKKYKKQLRHAFTKTFVQDYYVTNLDISPKMKEFIQTLDIDLLLSNDEDDYQIVHDKLLTTYHLKDVHNKEMGYFLIFKDLDMINISDIRLKHVIFVLGWLIVLSILLFLFFYFLNKKYRVSLEEEIDLKTMELKEINENLQATIEMETEKNRQNELKIIQHEKLVHIAQMFRNIAHHWRQPLSIITTSLSGLVFKLEYQDVSKEELKNTIDEAMDHAKELSSNIEFFSQSYNFDDTKEKLNMASIIEDAVKVLDPVLQNQHIKIIKNYENVEFELFYNKSKFLNMLVTILQNAYEALIQVDESSKIIQLSLINKEHHIMLSIEDNGIGIPKEILGKIFEPYTTTKHQSSGVGLSLYFARNMIVNDLHGSIEVKNLHQGAKVEISLPKNS